MLYDDKSEKLYDSLFDEYIIIGIDFGWKEFIASKDLGIKYLSDDIYEIVDKKKWMLTRIKYGIL